MGTIFKGFFILSIIKVNYAQQISGYGPVDVAELNPLTLNWNQVHFLVRENLLAIDELRDEQDAIYQDLHECFGLERCRKQENFIDGPPTHGENIQAGALLQTLRKTRLGLEGQHSVLEQSIRNQQRVYQQSNQFGGRGGGQGGGRSFGSSSSSSYGSRSNSGSSGSSHSYSRSYSSSSSSSKRYNGYSDYDDDGPLPNRG